MRKAGTALLLAAALAASVLASQVGAAVSRADVTPCTSLSVGWMGPATGPAASIGKEQLNFSKFAVARFNKANKTNFQFVLGDTQLNPANAQTVASKFHSNPDIIGVVGPAGSQEVEAVGPIFQAKGMAFISPSATRTTLTAVINGKLKYPTFFRVVPNDDAQGPTVANFMLAKGVKKAFIVDDQESYSTGLADKAQEVLKNKGVVVDRESVDQKTTDFSALVSKITSDTNAVFLPWQIAANAELFAEQMKEQGKTATVYGSDGLFSIKDFHPEGAYVSAFAPDIKSIPADKQLVAAYTKQYGSFGTFGPPSYLATLAMLSAMKRACGTAHPGRLAVLRALPSVKVPRSPLGGTFSFSATHDPAGAKFYLFQVKGGQFVGIHGV